MDLEETIAGRLRSLFEAGGFWSERWRRAGLARPPRALSEVPIATPGDLAADEAQHPPYGRWRACSDGFVRVGVPRWASPLELVVFTAGDLEREARVGASALGAAGLVVGMRETNTLPGGLPTPGSLIVGDAAQTLGALDMPVGPIEAEAPRAAAYDFWCRVRPDFAALDLAGARALAALLADKGTSAPALGLRAIALVTDVREPEPELPDLGLPVHRLIGLAEAFALLAARAVDGRFYPPAGEVVAEVLDGQLVLTTLQHSAALVRYAPGVRARSTQRAAAGGLREQGFELV